jgi:hypothetical protein
MDAANHSGHDSLYFHIPSQTPVTVRPKAPGPSGF